MTTETQNQLNSQKNPPCLYLTSMDVGRLRPDETAATVLRALPTVEGHRHRAVAGEEGEEVSAAIVALGTLALELAKVAKATAPTSRVDVKKAEVEQHRRALELAVDTAVASGQVRRTNVPPRRPNDPLGDLRVRDLAAFLRREWSRVRGTVSITTVDLDRAETAARELGPLAVAAERFARKEELHETLVSHWETVRLALVRSGIRAKDLKSIAPRLPEKRR